MKRFQGALAVLMLTQASFAASSKAPDILKHDESVPSYHARLKAGHEKQLQGSS